MKKVRPAPLSVDEYISGFPPELRRTLRKLRRVILEAAPGAEERISYQMPAFALNGILVYFAAWKDHIGFYPTSSGIRAFRSELSKYRPAQGSVRFPIDEPLPYDLVGRIVKFRVAENLRAKSVGKTRTR